MARKIRKKQAKRNYYKKPKIPYNYSNFY